VYFFGGQFGEVGKVAIIHKKDLTKFGYKFDIESIWSIFLATCPNPVQKSGNGYYYYYYYEIFGN
jgi:hypothetical protein